MSDSDASAFTKFIPGFDFLQNLSKGAGSGAMQMPHLGSWVAPTLDPQELDKRIAELKNVQFWLDQNVRALAATVQALEVQKMTLSTLQGMNFNLGDMASMFSPKAASKAEPKPTPSATPSPPPEATTATTPSAFAASFFMPKPAAPAPEPATPASAAQRPESEDDQGNDKDEGDDKGTDKGNDKDGAQSQAKGMVDPLQLWGALTQQFQKIAANVMHDSAAMQQAMQTQVAAQMPKATVRPKAAAKASTTFAAKPSAKVPTKASTKPSVKAPMKASAKKSQVKKAAASKPPAKPPAKTLAKKPAAKKSAR